MSQEDVKELFRHHREYQNKYAYFLLAVAASGVAFAIQRSESANFDWPLAPLALSILFFGLSFYMGIRQVHWVGATLGANYSYLQLLNDVHPDQPPPGVQLDGAIRGTKIALHSNIKKAADAAKWQIRLLFSGGISFVVWHALIIYLR